MKGKNKVNLLGNLGKNPEMIALESGKKLAKVSLATNETFNDKNSGEKRTVTEWHNLAFWGSKANTAMKYLKKGDCIDIEGKLKTIKYEDNEGVSRYITHINVMEIVMINTSGNSPTEQYNSVQFEHEEWQQDGEDDDVPF